MLLLLWPFPPVQTHLQYFHSLTLKRLSEWSYWVLVAEFSSHCKVSSFPITEGVTPWLNSPVSNDHCRTLFSVELIVALVDDIETGFVRAWTVDENRSINFVRLKTEVFGRVKICWHCWDTCFNFVSERAKVMFSVSYSNPRNSYLFHRMKDWFFEVDHKIQML